MTNLYSLFKLPKFDDPEQARTAKLLFSVLGLTLILFILSAIQAALMEPANLFRAVRSASIILGISIVIFVLLYRKKLVLASILYLFQLWMTITVSAISGGGMETPAVQGYLLVVLAAGLLIGWRAGLIMGVLCFVTELVITYAELTGLLGPYTGVRTPLTYFIVYILISNIVFLFVYHYSSSMRTSLNLAKQEIADRQRAELALGESEARMRVFANASFEGIAISVDTRVIEANEQFSRLLGYSLSDVHGATVEQLTAPESLDMILAHIAADYTEPYEAILIRKDGTKFPVEIRGRPIEHGGRKARLSVVRDLTAWKQAKLDVEQMFQELKQRNLELALAYDVTLEGWSKALDLRDKETEGHTLRVTEMSLRLARLMGVLDEDLASIRQGALLHDVGKLGIPDSILLKPGLLTSEEWVIMRRHPVYAYEWLSPIAHLRPALDIPYCHHERWDGSGYPRGLRGESIPLSARIFAIVDVYDALSSDRPYRKSWTLQHVKAHLVAERGKHFDPQVVDAFIRMLEEDGDLI